MSDVVKFEFAYDGRTYPVRKIDMQDGRPAWIAKDVCAALDLSNVSEALSGLDDDEKDVHVTPTRGGPQSLLFVTKAGLIKLVYKSRKPQARVWQRWLKEGGDPPKLETFLTSSLDPDVQASWVYFIEAPKVQLIKIGFTADVPKRLTSLQTMSPISLRLRGSFSGTRNDEHQLHEQFKHLRTHGEWFRSDPSLIGTIQALCTKVESA